MITKVSNEMPTDEFEKFTKQLRKLSNTAKYDKAHALCKAYLKKYPNSVFCAYREAVFSAEENTGYTPAQIKVRHKSAAQKLKALLPRLRAVPFLYRASIRNEYYWFSHQPYKQYLLGVEMVKKGRKRSYYSQGVGAVELAKVYAKQGKRKLFIRWAKIAEKAWLNFFREDPNWYNSYYFYAAALGYQGRIDEMNAALANAAKIAKKPKNWKTIVRIRRNIEDVIKEIERNEINRRK